jgi:cytochrome c556
MKLHARVLGLEVITLAAGIGLLAIAGGGSAADDDPKAKEIREYVLKLAEAMEKNNAAEIKAQTDALKKYDLLPIMKQLKLRDNGGIGIGQKGTITPDGIEAKLINLARNRPPLMKPQLEKESKDLAKAAYIMAAIAEVAKDKCPVKKKMGDKDPKDWAQWSEEMSKFSKELAKAAEAKDVDKVKTTSAKLNGACNACHGVFRD